MSVISIILISIFLSSSAEARHGAYNFKHYSYVYSCNNCDKLGVWSGRIHPYETYGTTFPRKGYKRPIWPTLPAKKLPYIE